MAFLKPCMHLYPTCLIAFCTILIVSCTKLDSPALATPDYISTEPLVDYTDHKAIPLVGRDKAISYLEARGDYIYYSTFDDELVAFHQSSTEATLLMEEVQTYSMDSGPAGVYFCTDRGIFQVGEDRVSLLQRTTHHCYDIEAVSSQELYYSSLRSFGDLSHYRLFRLEGDSVRSFSAGLKAQTLSFTRLHNGEFFVYAESIDPAIHRIASDGTIIQTFQGDDLPLRQRYLAHQVMLIPSEEGLLLFGDAGFAFPDIRAWSSVSQSWSPLLDPAMEETADEKWVQLKVPSYTDALPWKDQILVTTTSAGCRGVLRLAPRGGTTIGYDDFGLVQDANFSIGQCLAGFSLDLTTRSLYVYSQQQAMRLTLPLIETVD